MKRNVVADRKFRAVRFDVEAGDADRWSDALRTADAEGRFFTSYTGFLVSGIRPGDAG